MGKWFILGSKTVASNNSYIVLYLSFFRIFSHLNTLRKRLPAHLLGSKTWTFTQLSLQTAQPGINIHPQVDIYCKMEISLKFLLFPRGNQAVAAANCGSESWENGKSDEKNFNEFLSGGLFRFVGSASFNFQIKCWFRMKLLMSNGHSVSPK